MEARPAATGNTNGALHADTTPVSWPAEEPAPAYVAHTTAWSAAHDAVQAVQAASQSVRPTAAEPHDPAMCYAPNHGSDATGAIERLPEVPAQLPGYVTGRVAAPGSIGGGGGNGDAGTRRHHTENKPKDWAGGVVWAKLARYPWWPAQVLSERDPFIPVGEEPPRRGAVPVRFFGTYEFSWIESQRALAPFDEGYEDKAAKSKAQVFKQGVAEALHFNQTQELPDGFALAASEEAPAPPAQKPAKARKVAASKGKAKKGAVGTASVKGGKRAGGSRLAKKMRVEDPSSGGSRRSGKDRRDRMMRLLALKPPAGSPYASQLCLAGLEGLHVESYGGFTDPVAAVSGE